jgi:hypothetical protein
MPYDRLAQGATMDIKPLVRDETVKLGKLRLHYRDWGDPAASPLE